MGAELRNTADGTELLKELLVDRGRVDELRSILADDFIQQDRRKLIGLPDLDKATFIESSVSFAHQSGLVANELEKLAVRGERLGLGRYIGRYEDGSIVEHLVIGLWDVAGPRLQRMVYFDSDDLAEATAELDRMHAELKPHDG